MMFIKTVVTILTLGVYATGELCVDSNVMFKTESGEKTKCSELVSDGKLNCTQSDTFSHCKESCDVSFCCADSRASFGIKLTGTSRPKYKGCNWKPLKKACNQIDLFDTCPVTCGKCNPISVLLGMIGEQGTMIKEQGEVVDSLESKAMEQAIMIKDQGDLINKQERNIQDNVGIIEEQGAVVDGLESKAIEQAIAIKDQGDLINEQERNIQDNVGQIKYLEVEVFGYSHYSNYVYKPAEVALTWAEHEAAAVAWGGHIISIHSHAELDFILSLTGKEYSIYIGTYKDGGGNWKNIDGTPFDFTNWAKNEPTNNGESLVQMIANGQYNDVPDTHEFFSIYRKLRVL